MSNLKKTNKEASWAVGMTIFYLAGWIVCAYFSPKIDGPLHFPLWFELSCIYLPITFIVLIYWLIKIQFQTFSLEREGKGDE